MMMNLDELRGRQAFAMLLAILSSFTAVSAAVLQAVVVG